MMIPTLPKSFCTDFERLRTALQRRGEPDWVPFVDSLHVVQKQRVLGRRPHSLADEIAISQQLGYDFVQISIGLSESDEMRNVMTYQETDVGRSDDAYSVERRWANEGEGAITSEAELENFRWPDPDHFNYARFAEAERLLPPGMKIIAQMGKVFNSVWWLMGFEGFSVALAEQPELVARVFERVRGIQQRVVERVLEYSSVGAFWHADDLAHATGLLVSPAIYRRHVFPFYSRMNRECHRRAVLSVFHSDGDVSPVMEDVIAAGFDGFNPIEPKAMDIVALKQQVGSRIALLGNIDLGYTLTLGTPAEVEAEVKERIRVLAPGGGYCLGSSNSIPDYVPFDNYLAMRSAWMAYGRYPITV